MDVESIRQKLKSTGQQNVLRFFESLDSGGKDRLLKQVQALDLNYLSQLVDEYVRHKPTVALPKKIEPVRIYPRKPKSDQEKLYADSERRGRELLKQGKVAAFLVAGGQGTR